MSLVIIQVIDWKEAAVQIYEEDLPTLMQTIKTEVSEERLEEMHKQVGINCLPCYLNKHTH